jgi:hypothetical protein
VSLPVRQLAGCATRTRGKGVSVTLCVEKSTEWTFRRIHGLANEVAVWKKNPSDYDGGGHEVGARLFRASCRNRGGQ